MIRASVKKQSDNETNMGHNIAKGPNNSATPRKSNDSLGTVTFSPEEGDIIGPLTTAVALNRKVNEKEQRIVVTGDADFLSNKEFNRPQRTANFVFSTALFRWMSGGEFPVDTRRPDPRDKKIKTTLEKLNREKKIYQWVVPGILLLFGLVVLFRRKRK
jgi:ABC-2 type transport system permease protein